MPPVKGSSLYLFQRNYLKPGYSRLLRREKYLANLKKQAAKIKEWLDDNDDRTGSNGKPIKSNITDNESAKLTISQGVVQGYVGAEALGQGGRKLFTPADFVFPADLSYGLCLEERSCIGMVAMYEYTVEPVLYCP